MAARTAAATAAATVNADSYVGSLIGLTTKSDIRYQGFIFHINAQETTIGLRHVKSYGTEGRRNDGSQVPPSEKIFEYVYFRGSDIKDLQVIAPPPAQSTTILPDDPAIIRSDVSIPLPMNVITPNDPAIIRTHFNQLPMPMGLLSPGGAPSGPHAPSNYWSGFPGPQPLPPPPPPPQFLFQQTKFPPLPPPPPPQMVAQPYQNQSENSTLYTSLFNIALIPPITDPGLFTNPCINLSNNVSSQMISSSVQSGPTLVCPSMLSSSSSTTETIKPDTLSHLDLNDEPTDSYSDNDSELIPNPKPLVFSLINTEEPKQEKLAKISAMQMHELQTFQNNWEQARGQQNGVKKPPLYPRYDNRSFRGGNGPNGYNRGTYHPSRTHGRGGSMVYESKKDSSIDYSEDFDFEAMNKKFNKEEVWGILAKSSKADGSNEENGYKESNNKVVYSKDEFFDELGSTNVNHETRKGKEEAKRIDNETFGETSAYPSRGGGRRGGGTGRGRTMWNRANNERNFFRDDN